MSKALNLATLTVVPRPVPRDADLGLGGGWLAQAASLNRELRREWGQELARGARYGALLDDVCGIASVLARLRPRRRWRRDPEPPPPAGEEPIAV